MWLDFQCWSFSTAFALFFSLNPNFTSAFDLTYSCQSLSSCHISDFNLCHPVSASTWPSSANIRRRAGNCGVLRRRHGINTPCLSFGQLGLELRYLTSLPNLVISIPPHPSFGCHPFCLLLTNSFIIL